MTDEIKSKKNVPATLGVVMELRNEMITRFHGVDAKFTSIDARFNEVDARFEQIDKRFEQVDARFDSLEAKMDSRFTSLEAKMASSLHEMKILVEQQDAKNDYVLDGLSFLYQKTERLEERQDEIENWLKGLRN